MADIVCLGQFTADVIVAPVCEYPEKGKAVFVESISLSNGGSACNAAVALGKIGTDTAVIGKVGVDAFGDFLIRLLNDVGLDTSGMVRDPGVRTSSTVVLVSPDGERSFLHYTGGNARLSEDEIDYGIIGQARILHVAAAFLVGGLDGEPMARVLARARGMGVHTSLDTAWDADGRWMSVLEPCLAHVDTFLPSLDEAQMLTGEERPREIAEALLGYGIKTVVIKLGADGCYARTQDAEFSAPAFEVEAVADTLGAGDSFVAGMLTGLVNGWDLRRACRLANAAGACCVGATGTTGVRPLREIVERYGL
jgi:sugar/nucleoside kinase (ribokinase family)